MKKEFERIEDLPYKMECKHSFLTPEEERELLEHKTDQGARDRLCENHSRFVGSICRQFVDTSETTGGYPEIEAYQNGMSGLLKAIDRFKLTMPNGLLAYAESYIKKAVLDGRRDSILAVRLPSQAYGKLNSLNHIRDTMTEKLGREPTTKEIADYAKISQKKVENLFNALDALSLDQEPNKDAGNDFAEGNSFGDTIEDKSMDTVKAAEQKILENNIQQLLEVLSPKEIKVLILKYVDDYTFEEIGQKLDVPITRQGVFRIHEAACEKIRPLAEKIGLRDFI